MPELQNIPNERSEDEKSHHPQEEMNENSFPAQPIESIEPLVSNVTQDIVNRDIYHHSQISHRNYSVVLVYLLWVLGVLCLCTYIYIDARLIYIDNRLTRNLPPLKERGIFYIISRITHLLTMTFLAFSLIWTLFKAHKSRAVIYFVLVLELFVLSGIAEQLYIMEIFNRYPDFIASFVAVIGIFLIKLFQEFPLHLTKQDINLALAHRRFGRRLIRPLSWLLKMQYCCLIFLPLFLGIACLATGLNFLIRMWLISAIAITVGSCYVYIQINCSSRKQLQPLYWWLWVLLMYLLYYLYSIITHLLNLGLPDEIWMILFTIALISIIISCLMTMYFTDILDATLVLHKTFLYGSLLMILLTFFGSMEHYAIDNLAQWLHLENNVISSIFAGLTGLLFHPLKEKLSHWIKHFQKGEMKVQAYQ